MFLRGYPQQKNTEFALIPWVDLARAGDARTPRPATPLSPKHDYTAVPLPYRSRLETFTTAYGLSRVACSQSGSATTTELGPI